MVSGIIRDFSYRIVAGIQGYHLVREQGGEEPPVPRRRDWRAQADFKASNGLGGRDIKAPEITAIYDRLLDIAKTGKPGQLINYLGVRE